MRVKGKHPRSISTASSPFSSRMAYSAASSRSMPVDRRPKKKTPASVLLWAFSRMPPRRVKKGVTTRAIVNFIKKFYAPMGAKSPGRAISTALRRGIEFGLIEKKGNRHFLAKELD